MKKADTNTGDCHVSCTNLFIVLQESERRLDAAFGALIDRNKHKKLLYEYSFCK